MFRLLLIDDSQHDRLLIARQLRREFPDVQIDEIKEQKNLDDALSSGNFDLVITDYQLRWNDGISVLREIKSHFPDCPVIMFTGSGDEDVAVTAMKAGLDDYLSKSPKHFSRLPFVVRAAFQRSQDIATRKRMETELQHQLERERLITRIAQRIRQSLNLEEILSTAVVEVRQFLLTDRVIICRFDSDKSGVVITESVDRRWRALSGNHIPKTYFIEVCGQENGLEHTQAIKDIAEINTSQLGIELLEQMQVRANLAVPVFQGQTLWGVLIAHHCSAPRRWQTLEMNLLEQLAGQIGIAIQQSELYQQVQQLNTHLEQQVHSRTAQLRQAFGFEAMLKRITDRVRDSLDERHILQTAVQELALVVGVSGCNAALYNLDEGTSTILYEYTTSTASLRGRVVQMANFPGVYSQLLQGHCFQHCILEHELIERRTVVLSCPILDDQSVIGDLWLTNHSNYEFSEQDIRLVKQVANQCAIALRQTQLYKAAQSQVAELQRLNQLKDDFLSTVSHELRTPISNMKMALQMLKIASTDERRQRYIEILQTECERESALIKDLLDLQRLETNSYPDFLVEAIDLYEWLPHILISFRGQAEEHQQTLLLDLPSNLPRIISDRTSLERILTELLTNTCKYTESGGSIVVEVRFVASTPPTPESGFTFIIRNQAEIPASELPHIFEKFYRVPNADPWKQGGTGLGLALVQNLVKRLQGTIQVTSQAGWTTFTIQFPARLNF